MRSLLLALAAAALSACSTLSPDPPVPDAAGPQHSGIYAHSLNADGSLRTQWWFGWHRDQYNALIGLCGGGFAPAILPDDNLIRDGAYWKANHQARTQYEEMAELRREGKGL